MPKIVSIALALGVTVAASVDADAHEDPSHADAYARRLAELKTWFEPGAIAAGPTLVDCKLSGGAVAKCFSITLKPAPSGYKAGPWCPSNITDGPEKSGIWLDKGKVYSADGPFVANLKIFYKDDTWQLFDPETGKVRVTTTKEACQAAARPDVDPKYRNYCVECQTSYMAPDSVSTYVIPIEPAPLRGPSKRIGPHGGVGISFNGPRFDAPAPVDAILGAHTLAPFDKCGGHVNLHAGYHIHAVTDCVKQIESQERHAPVIGIAMDGYPLHARLDANGKEPDDLDGCRGHSVDGLGYHYHVAHPGENAIIGCHKAETGCVFEGGPQTCDATMWGGIRRRVLNWFN